jgi:hypothetical protein
VRFPLKSISGGLIRTHVAPSSDERQTCPKAATYTVVAIRLTPNCEPKLDSTANVLVPNATDTRDGSSRVNVRPPSVDLQIP